MTPEERFFRHVVPNDDPLGCWLWRKPSSSTGYGQFTVGRRRFMAHRWIYELMRDSIPPGLEIDHLCRQRACVNPWHLEPVTRRVNLLRGERPNNRAWRTECSKGHPFDAGNTHMNRRGARVCRTCARDGLRRRRALHGPKYGIRSSPA